MPERVAPASASRSGPVPRVGAPNGAGNSAVSYGRNDRDVVVYFDFFGTRFFGLGPDRPDGSASSPWHGKHL